MGTTELRILGLAFGTVLLGFAYRSTARSTITDTARNFLASLSPDQKATAILPFNEDERFNWHYVPKARKGVPLLGMTATQRHLAEALLSAGLSSRGYIKAKTIMSLEEILRVLEKDSGERRNPEKYHFTIFGEPSESGVWGYRVEGHHLSLNFTLVNGRVAASPGFFGANPAEVRDGPRKGLRALAAEEDLARQLLDALAPDQRRQAIVDETAYPEILTSNSRKASIEGQPDGLAAGKMTPAQKSILQTLLQEYANNLNPELAEARTEAVKKAGSRISFAWAGSPERGKPHYYRIQAPTFLIEYDNTQNNANHIHTVWRDFEGDFGLDLLKMHYESSPHRK